jgi:hypothetical protein
MQGWAGAFACGAPTVPTPSTSHQGSAPAPERDPENVLLWKDPPAYV